jgi:hypothetical protein
MSVKNARIYLCGARTRFEDECTDEPDFIWCDELWPHVEHFLISFDDKNNLWSVGHFVGGCVYPEDEDITAEEVVHVIHRLSGGVIDRRNRVKITKKKDS